MSFDYISDKYGENRQKGSRFTQLENRAISSLKSFVDGTICNKDFAKAFNEILEQFMEMTKVNGQVTIDEDTPLWLNSTLGHLYLDWHKVHRVIWYYEEHPDELTEDLKERYSILLKLKDDYDQRFRHTCKKVLKN